MTREERNSERDVGGAGERRMERRVRGRSRLEEMTDERDWGRDWYVPDRCRWNSSSVTGACAAEPVGAAGGANACAEVEGGGTWGGDDAAEGDIGGGRGAKTPRKMSLDDMGFRTGSAGRGAACAAAGGGEDVDAYHQCCTICPSPSSNCLEPKLRSYRATRLALIFVPVQTRPEATHPLDRRFSLHVHIDLCYHRFRRSALGICVDRHRICCLARAM